jgi:hypothetical protein
MSRSLMTIKSEILTYLKGGRATITVLNTRTDKRYTYKVKAKRVDGKIQSCYTIKVMTGSDNVKDYTTLGYIPSVGRQNIRKFPGQKIGFDDVRSQGFSWLWNQLHSDKPLPSTVQIWHEGSCSYCGRKLTVPESVSRGVGPECWDKYCS